MKPRVKSKSKQPRTSSSSLPQAKPKGNTSSGRRKSGTYLEERRPEHYAG